MKHGDIFLLDKCEMTVDKKKKSILDPMWIYTNWESQSVTLCPPLPYNIYILKLKEWII